MGLFLWDGLLLFFFFLFCSRSVHAHSYSFSLLKKPPTTKWKGEMERGRKEKGPSQGTLHLLSLNLRAGRRSQIHIDLCSKFWDESLNEMAFLCFSPLLWFKTFFLMKSVVVSVQQTTVDLLCETDQAQVFMEIIFVYCSSPLWTPSCPA